MSMDMESDTSMSDSSDTSMSDSSDSHIECGDLSDLKWHLYIANDDSSDDDEAFWYDADADYIHPAKLAGCYVNRDKILNDLDCITNDEVTIEGVFDLIFDTDYWKHMVDSTNKYYWFNASKHLYKRERVTHESELQHYLAILLRHAMVRGSYKRLFRNNHIGDRITKGMSIKRFLDIGSIICLGSEVAQYYKTTHVNYEPYQKHRRGITYLLHQCNEYIVFDSSYISLDDFSVGAYSKRHPYQTRQPKAPKQAVKIHSIATCISNQYGYNICIRIAAGKHTYKNIQKVVRTEGKTDSVINYFCGIIDKRLKHESNIVVTLDRGYCSVYTMAILSQKYPGIRFIGIIQQNRKYLPKKNAKLDTKHMKDHGIVGDYVQYRTKHNGVHMHLTVMKLRDSQNKDTQVQWFLDNYIDPSSRTRYMHRQKRDGEWVERYYEAPDVLNQYRLHSHSVDRCANRLANIRLKKRFHRKYLREILVLIQTALTNVMIIYNAIAPKRINRDQLYDKIIQHLYNKRMNYYAYKKVSMEMRSRNHVKNIQSNVAMHNPRATHKMKSITSRGTKDKRRKCKSCSRKTSFCCTICSTKAHQEIGFCAPGTGRSCFKDKHDEWKFDYAL